MEERLDALLAILRDVEWGAYGEHMGDSVGECPSCHNLSCHRHDATCALAAALAREDALRDTGKAVIQ